jgi:hypothetical protein
MANQPSPNHMRQRDRFTVSSVRTGDVVFHLRCRSGFLEPERLDRLGRWLNKLALGYDLWVVKFQEVE